MGDAKTKENVRDLRCYKMEYGFIPLAIETGGRQAEVTEACLCRLIDIAGGASLDSKPLELWYAHAAITAPRL